MKTAVTFTGHRPQDLYGYGDSEGTQRIKDWLMRKIDAVVRKHKDVHFIAGGALGIDTWAAEAVLVVRDLYPQYDITLEIAVPCKNQDKKWRKESKQLYREILDKADQVTMVSEKEYHGNCMQVRNEYMVDNADAVISVWSGKTHGGTWNCLEYAEEQGLPMLLLQPFQFVQCKVKRGEKIFPSRTAR